MGHEPISKVVGAILFILLAVGLTATATNPSDIAVISIKAMSPMYRELVRIHQRRPVLEGLGRDIYLSRIDCLGVSAFEMTYEHLPGSDCFSRNCAEALVVYVGKDGTFQRLNFCPLGFQERTFSIEPHSQCITAFKEFLQAEKLDSKLTKQAKAHLFVALCCHSECGDFPVFEETVSDATPPKSSVYVFSAKYGKHLAKSYTQDPVSEEWWYPLVRYELRFAKNGDIVSGNATVLNAPGR